jgi:hypothetical protein
VPHLVGFETSRNLGTVYTSFITYLCLDYPRFLRFVTRAGS